MRWTRSNTCSSEWQAFSIFANHFVRTEKKTTTFYAQNNGKHTNVLVYNCNLINMGNACSAESWIRHIFKYDPQRRTCIFWLSCFINSPIFINVVVSEIAFWLNRLFSVRLFLNPKSLLNKLGKIFLQCATIHPRRDKQTSWLLTNKALKENASINIWPNIQ